MLFRKVRPGDHLTIGEVGVEVMPSLGLPRLQINAPIDQRVQITKGDDALWSKNPDAIQKGDVVQVGSIHLHVRSHSSNSMEIGIAAPQNVKILHTRAEKAPC